MTKTAEIIEEIAWGEYDTAIQALNKRHSARIQEALAGALRQDWEDRYRDQVTVFFAILGLHDYYHSSVYVHNNSTVHLLSAKNPGDGDTVRGRKVCRGDIVHSTWAMHAPPHAWFNSAEYGLKQCRTCWTKQMQADGFDVGPDDPNSYLDSLSEDGKKAWSLIIEESFKNVLGESYSDESELVEAIDAAWQSGLVSYAEAAMQAFGLSVWTSELKPRRDPQIAELANHLGIKRKDLDILNYLPKGWASQAAKMSWEAASRGKFFHAQMYSPSADETRVLDVNYVSHVNDQIMGAALADVINSEVHARKTTSSPVTKALTKK